VSSETRLPLVVQRPLYGPHGQAVVVLLTPSGALFDGDALNLQITCGPGADVTLTTAAATKLNRCDHGGIRFDVEARVSAAATFRYLPHELIPFRGTRYQQRIEMDLDDAARAWLLEVIGPGRTDEQFTYTELGFETNVRHTGALRVRERFTLTPASAAQLRGHTHYGSLLAFGPEMDRSAATLVNQRLACISHGVGGASELPGSGVGLKMLGGAAQTVREALLRAVGLPRWLLPLLPP
jgi:urease accessory protein